jgi:uncharacterized membrane protein
VHHARVLGREADRGLFEDGQGVHVAAEDHCATASGALDDADDAGFGDAGAVRYAQRGEPLGNASGGAHFLVGELGMLMDRPPILDQLWLQSPGRLEQFLGVGLHDSHSRKVGFGLALRCLAGKSQPHFRNRSESVSRLEGFSDTAFGFAITLLVVSLAVPAHFSELLQQLRGLPVFAVTFALVSVIWYAQFVFFRRYAMSDPVTVMLTLLLLFVVLFYVYPLKFLFSVVFSVGAAPLQQADAPLLFLIYGLGFAGVNLVLALLYMNAHRKREELALTDWERFVTRVSIADNLATMVIGLLSAGLAVALPISYAGSVAGYIYFAVAVPKAAAGAYIGRRARALARPPATRPASN